MARANCNTATMPKITAARIEKFLAVITLPPFSDALIHRAILGCDSAWKPEIIWP
jgi:hypothetical protein